MENVGWHMGVLCGNMVPAGEKDDQKKIKMVKKKKYLDPKDALNTSFKSLIW